MRYALVDNATLTAVQRLVGEIPVKNLYLIDGDIAAAENYIQSILFYDCLFFVDDYKTQFREQRTKYFRNMLPLQLSDSQYDAAILTAKISLKI